MNKRYLFSLFFIFASPQFSKGMEQSTAHSEIPVLSIIAVTQYTYAHLSSQLGTETLEQRRFTAICSEQRRVPQLPPLNSLNLPMPASSPQGQAMRRPTQSKPALPLAATAATRKSAFTPVTQPISLSTSKKIAKEKLPRAKKPRAIRRYQRSKLPNTCVFSQHNPLEPVAFNKGLQQ